jgi:hypothetical protein
MLLLTVPDYLMVFSESKIFLFIFYLCLVGASPSHPAAGVGEGALVNWARKGLDSSLRYCGLPHEARLPTGVPGIELSSACRYWIPITKYYIINRIVELHWEALGNDSAANFYKNFLPDQPKNETINKFGFISHPSLVKRTKFRPQIFWMVRFLRSLLCFAAEISGLGWLIFVIIS